MAGKKAWPERRHGRKEGMRMIVKRLIEILKGLDQESDIQVMNVSEYGDVSITSDIKLVKYQDGSHLLSCN
ncbi:MAG: hypothetical protein PHH48_08970 [Eubacteriales bacterium]|nr:hypothetical protein [Eubacteriales bacterium]